MTTAGPSPRAEAAGLPRRFTLILNPAARRGRAARDGARIVAACQGRGLPAKLEVSTHPRHPASLAAAALAAGRIPVACGGDGLVRAMADEVAGHGGVLGIVPVGSGNDAARELGIAPGDIAAAVATLATGEPRAVDLGVAGGSRFCTAAVVGFAAAANARANRTLWGGHPAVYAVAVLRTLMSYRPRRYALELDGTRSDEAAWLIALANGRWLGGGMKIAPEAMPDDGLLDVVTIGPISRPDFLRTFPKVYDGSHLSHPAISVRRAARVAIDVDGDSSERAVFADGEPLAALPQSFTVAARSLRVIAGSPPRGS